MPADIMLFLPETIVLVGALVTFIVSIAGSAPDQRGQIDLAAERRLRGMTWIAAMITSIAALGAAAWTFTLDPGWAFHHTVYGVYRVDLFSQLLKFSVALGLALVLLISRDVSTLRSNARVDLPIFFLVSAVGMMMMVSATELLTLYVALEMSAYGLYVAVALHRRAAAGTEAAAKYVLFGAASSAVTLYGVSLIYGVTGTTYLEAIQTISQLGGSTMLTVGMVMMLSGFFFKLAVMPFHFWAPDVYQGAPDQVVAFVATTSKIAAIGVIARLCTLVVPQQGGGIVEIFSVLTVLSMTIGNLAALAQRDLKRLLGYSTVAHAGYLMLGFGAFSLEGLTAVLFYGIAYLAMNHLAFTVVCAVSDSTGENATFDTIAGLWSRSPEAALMLLIALFALAGIPPTAGFSGKWFLFSAALDGWGDNPIKFALVLIAAINSTIGLYYYLQVVKAAYLHEPGDLPALQLPFAYRLGGWLSITLITLAGIYPTTLWTIARDAATILMRGTGAGG